MTLDMLFSLFGAVATLVAGAWALVKIVVSQFETRLDERFKAQECARKIGQDEWGRRIGRIEDTLTRHERDELALRAELPKEYVRREDHIRFETVITAKLDAVAAKMDLFAERQRKE